jgi:hypothetical protein
MAREERWERRVEEEEAKKEEEGETYAAWQYEINEKKATQHTAT